MVTSVEEARISRKVIDVFNEYLADCQREMTSADPIARAELSISIEACRELRRRVAAILTGEITEDITPPDGVKK